MNVYATVYNKLEPLSRPNSTHLANNKHIYTNNQKVYKQFGYKIRTPLPLSEQLLSPCTLALSSSELVPRQSIDHQTDNNPKL